MKYYRNPNVFREYIATKSYNSINDIIDMLRERSNNEEAISLYGFFLRKFALEKNSLTASDLKSCKLLLGPYGDFFSLSVRDRFLKNLCTVKFRLKYHEDFKRSQNEIQGTHLRLHSKIEHIEEIRKEISTHEPLWSLDVSRQNSIIHHRNTNQIVLRNLFYGNTLVSVDGQYSYEEQIAKLFPKTMEVLENFRKSLDGTFGRVALVRLKPYQSVFRHSDEDIVLKGFDRYHLVIASKHGSYMSCENEVRVFKEGEMFFFENKVLHTAYNFSDSWRIHCIIDMRVEEKYNLSSPIYSYEEWARYSP